MQDMKKYYETLGISEKSSEEEIKKAYIILKRKYDPENYDKPDLKEHAETKTKEITEAFDKIMNNIRTKQIENKNENNQNYFKNVEQLIEENQLQKAEDILMGVPQEKRIARWYYLRGNILLKKGWLMDASNFFSTALSMEPDNEEYKKAYEKIMWQKNGGFNNPNNGPYQNQYPPQGPMGCSFCDICGAMMCMDMCCDCGMPRGPRCM